LQEKTVEGILYVLEYRLVAMRRFPVMACLALLCFPSALVYAQVSLQGPTNAPDGEAVYTLEGTVVNSVAREPIGRALVELHSMGVRGVLTGPDGHFKFTGLPSGSQSITARKPGFLDERSVHDPAFLFRSNLPGVQVGPDTLPITLTLVPESVITGTVNETNGDAVEGVVVKVMQQAIVDGRKRWRMAGQARTDEDGHFRVAELSSGSYYVAVMGGPHRAALDDFSETSPTGYPSIVYYPQSPDRASALPAELKAGQRLELPFELKKVPVFKISGTVTGATNHASVVLQLVNDDDDEVLLPVRYDPATSRFEISAAPAGRYRLIARSDMNTEAPLNVSGNITGLRFDLHPPVSIPVMVRQEFSSNNSTPASVSVPASAAISPPVSIMFHALSGNREDLYRSIEVDSNGGMHVYGLQAGKYLAEITSTAGGYVYSARCGSTDLLREPLSVTDGVPAIEVVLRDDGGSLSVIAPGAAAGSRNMLVLVSEREAVAPRLLYFFGQAESSMGALAPGRYTAFAFDSANNIEFRNPEVLNQFASQASQVVITPNGTARVSVELIHIPE
jgi:hypothetical protein